MVRIKGRSVGIALFSRAASSQVSSAPVSLTTVFGMGTGGSSPSLTPTLPFYLGRIYSVYTSYEGVPSKPNNTHYLSNSKKLFKFLYPKIRYVWTFSFWSSPRPISISQLNASRHLHLWPINHIVFVGSYQLALWDILSHGGLHA